MPLGPLVAVDTLVENINLDVSRLLRLGQNTRLKLIVPDANSLTKWRTLKTIKEGFDRTTGDELTANDSRTVIYRIADVGGTLAPILQTSNLHVEVLGEILSVAMTDSPAPNEAQVYTLTCKTRTMRNKHFDR